MTNTDASITYDSESNSGSFPSGEYSLDDGDTLTISLGSSFPGDSAITELSFTYWATGQSAGSWTPSGGISPGLQNIYSVTVLSSNGNGATSVQLEDLESPQQDDDFGLTVTGTTPDDTNPWQTDPELINKPGG